MEKETTGKPDGGNPGVAVDPEDCAYLVDHLLMAIVDVAQRGHDRGEEFRPENRFATILGLAEVAREKLGEALDGGLGSARIGEPA